MKAIFMISLLNIRKKKLQTSILAFCILLCSAFLLSAMVLGNGVGQSFQTTFDLLDTPDLLIGIEEADASEEQIENIVSQIDGINKYQIDSSFLANRVWLPERQINFAYIMGAETVPVPYGKIYVSNVVKNVTEGEEITISLNQKEVTFIVEGIHLDPVNSAPDSAIPCFWINERQLQEITLGFEKGTHQIMVNCKDPEQFCASFLMDYESKLGKSFQGKLTTGDDIERLYTFRYKLFSQFFLIISGVVFLITSILMIIIIRMNILTDMKKIGILKAMGFTDRKIHSIYFIQYLVIGLVSSITGAGLSAWVLDTWLSGMFRNIDPQMFHIKNITLYQTGVLFTVLTVMFPILFFSIHKFLKNSVYDTMNYKIKTKGKKGLGIILPTPHLLIENLALIKILRRKAETILLIVMGVGIGCLCLTCAQLIDGVSKVDEYRADWGAVEMDIYVARKSNISEKSSGLLNALDKEEMVDFYYAGLNDYVAYRLPKSGVVQTTVGEVYHQTIDEKLEFQFIEGRNPLNYNEVALGMNFAKNNNLNIGDKVVILNHGEERYLNVVGIYPTFNYYSDTMRFLTEDIEEFFGNKATGYYSVVLKQGTNVQDFIEKYTREYEDFDFYPMNSSSSRFLKILVPPMVMIMFLFTLIFFLIMICLSRLMLVEQNQDIKNYTAIGTTIQAIKKLFRMRLGLPAIMGMLGAIPLSIWVIPYLLKPLAGQLGLSKLPMYPEPGFIVCVLVAVFLFQVLSTKISVKEIGRKIKTSKKK